MIIRFNPIKRNTALPGTVPGGLKIKTVVTAGEIREAMTPSGFIMVSNDKVTIGYPMDLPAEFALAPDNTRFTLYLTSENATVKKVEESTSAVTMTKETYDEIMKDRNRILDEMFGDIFADMKKRGLI